MRIQTIRVEISKVYPNDIWAKKVQKMSDNQAIAIWYSFQKAGKFDKPIVSMPKNLGGSQSYEQLSLFDNMIFGYDEGSAEDVSCLIACSIDDEGKIEVKDVYYGEEDV